MAGRRGRGKCGGSGELSRVLPSAELGRLRHVERNGRHVGLGTADNHDPAKKSARNRMWRPSFVWRESAAPVCSRSGKTGSGSRGVPIYQHAGIEVDGTFVISPLV